MCCALGTSAEASCQPVRIGITRQQKHLEEEHAGRPHGWGSTEPGQEVLSEYELHREQKESPEEYGQRVRQRNGVGRDFVRNLQLEYFKPEAILHVEQTDARQKRVPGKFSVANIALAILYLILIRAKKRSRF